VKGNSGAALYNSREFREKQWSSRIRQLTESSDGISSSLIVAYCLKGVANYRLEVPARGPMETPIATRLHRSYIGRVPPAMLRVFFEE
jgi:hypothetical protein